METAEKVNLSVILPTYKRDKILCATLSQLLKQNPAPLEIIVIDQTKEHDPDVQAFLQELVRQGKIKYMYQKEPRANLARNRAVAMAAADIVLILNDDIVIDEHLIGAHFRNFSDPSIAAVSGLVYEHTDKKAYELPRRYFWKFTGWMYFPLNFGRRSEVINLNACNLSIRKAVFMESGGFDENFVKTSYDDSDLSLRVHKLCVRKGLKTVHDPEAWLIHLLEPTAAGENRPSGYNEYVIADRHTWKTWLYYFLINYGLLSAAEIALKLRMCVFRKKNMLRPQYLCAALFEFTLGLFLALGLIMGGRKLPFLKNHADPSG